jgi:superfamily I DNA/RNA helicase
VVRAATEVIARSPGRAPRSLMPLDPDGAPVERYLCSDDREEADLVAAEIERALGGTSLESIDAGRADGNDSGALAFHDVAILVRARAQGDAVAEALARAGIPFQRAGGDGLEPGPLDVQVEPQKVALLTLHASKGLEWPLVFVLGCEDGLLPLRLPWLPAIDLEEERRLLYVGMTRARIRLVLTAARRRAIFGRTVENRATPFLDDLPAGTIAERRAARRPRGPRQLGLF